MAMEYLRIREIFLLCFARVTVLVTLVTVLIAENSRMIRKLLRRILDY